MNNSMIEIFLSNRKTIKNGLWLYLLQFFNAFLPLMTLPYITRILGPECYGGVVISLNVIGYLQVVIEYGFGLSATREVALIDEKDKKQLNKLFSAVVGSRMILYLLCLLFLVIYSFFIHDSMNIICVVIMFAGLLGICFQQNWLFQGLQEMNHIALINIVARCISVIFIFLFVNNADDVFLYCVFYSATPLICGLLGVMVAFYRFNIKICKIRIRDVEEQLKCGWNVFCTQLSAKVFSAIGITFLGILSTKHDVGIYSAIQKIPSLFFLCWSPIGQVLFPYSSKQMANHFFEGVRRIKKIRKRIIIVFLIPTIFVSFFAKHIVLLLFGEEYISYYYVLYPLLIWVIFAINNNFLGIQILLGGGFDKEYSTCFHISVICTVVLNYILIVLLGVLGAALAPMISEIILMLLINLEIKGIERKDEKSTRCRGNAS